MEVKVHGYCWKDTREAMYMKIHGPILSLLGHDTSITHLAIQFGRWVVHPFSSSQIKWIKEDVDRRIFEPPCRTLVIGHTNKQLLELMSVTKEYKTHVWSAYLWFYTCGLYYNKKDCTSFVRDMLKYSMGIDIPRRQFPSSLLKELENNGYRSS